MWIMLNTAFVSIVDPAPGSPAAKADQLVCRARVKGHLEAAFGDFARNVAVGKGTDYHYRCLVPRKVAAKVIADHVLRIDYGNFKNSVKNKPYHDSLMGVWTIMHRLQERFMPRQRGRQATMRFSDYDDYGPGVPIRHALPDFTAGLDDDLDWSPDRRYPR